MIALKSARLAGLTTSIACASITRERVRRVDEHDLKAHGIGRDAKCQQSARGLWQAHVRRMPCAHC